MVSLNEENNKEFIFSYFKYSDADLSCNDINLISVVGPNRVGKSCFINTLLECDLKYYIPTLGIDYRIGTFNYKRRSITLLFKEYSFKLYNQLKIKQMESNSNNNNKNKVFDSVFIKKNSNYMNSHTDNNIRRENNNDIIKETLKTSDEHINNLNKKLNKEIVLFFLDLETYFLISSSIYKSDRGYKKLFGISNETKNKELIYILIENAFNDEQINKLKKVQTTINRINKENNEDSSVIDLSISTVSNNDIKSKDCNDNSNKGKLDNLNNHSGDNICKTKLYRINIYDSIAVNNIMKDIFEYILK